MRRFYLLPVFCILIASSLWGQVITFDTDSIARLIDSAEHKENAENFNKRTGFIRQALALPCDQSPDCLKVRARAALLAVRNYRASASRDSAMIFCRLAYHLRWTLLGDTSSEDARLIVTFLGHAYSEKTMLDSALYCYRRALKLSQSSFGPESKEVASALTNMGSVYKDKGEYVHSLDCLKKALAIRLQANSTDKQLLPQSYYLLGVLYRDMGLLDSAISNLETGRLYAVRNLDTMRELNCMMIKAQCLSLKNHHREAVALYEEVLQRRIVLWGNNPEHPMLAQHYGDFGALLSLNGEFDRAKAYLEKAVSMLRGQSCDPALPIVLQQAASNLMKINPSDTLAQSLLLEAATILKGSKARPKDLAYTYENLGVFAYQKQQYREAVSWLQDALTLRESIGDSLSLVTVHNLNLLSESQIFAGNPQTALSNSRRALAIMEKSGDLRQAEYLLALVQCARAHTHLKQWDAARALLDQAAEYLNMDPVHPDFLNIIDLNQASRVLENRAELLLEQAGNLRRDLLPEIKNVIHLNLQLLDFQQRTLIGEEPRLYHRTKTHDIYTQALALALLEGNPAEAFQYAELDKAQALRSDYLTQPAVAQPSGTLDFLLDSIRNMQAEVAFWTQRLQQGVLSAAGRNDISLQLFHCRLQLEEQWRKIRVNYPDEWQGRFGESGFDLTALRRNIVPEHTALIEFHFGLKNLTTFLLNADTLLVWQNSNPEQLKVLIGSYLQYMLHKRRMSPAMLDSCHLYSHMLYQLLLAQPLAALKPGVQHLIIVPEGVLARLPFAALLTAPTPKGPPAQWPFLIKQFALSYAFSGTLLADQQNQQVSQAPEPFGGFAPEYTALDLNKRLQPFVRDGEEDYDLQFAREEVRLLSKLTNGTAWVARDATEERFRLLAARYRILHLAMHAVADVLHPALSKILFTAPVRDTLPAFDGNFYAGDLPGLRLDADLVTLSACRTAIGRIIPGESTLSLAYAFTRAGAPAVAASLWPADDQLTMFLMTGFYEQMSAGLPKDEALRRAQLMLIEQSEETPEYAHPFYWATFGVIGSMKPLVLKK